MHGKAPLRNSSFAKSMCTATVTLALMWAAVLAPAQNAVPPTAREAAASPAFVSRLARPATPEAAGKLRASPSGRISPLYQVLYENGPVNGTTDAWTINFGYVVSDSFTLATGSTVTGFDLNTWEFPGDSVSQVDWSITSGENGGTVFGSGTVHVTDTFISTNQYGYDIEKITASGLNVSLNVGTFWFNVQNASVPSGDPVYWDENSGKGCNSPGCPSQASDNTVGTIPSEAFDITGTGGGCSGGGSGSFKVLYNFTGGADGAVPNAATMDRSGNIYGTNSGNCNGDGCQRGIAFKLANLSYGWVLTPLYDFGTNENEFARLIGPDGSLYGTTPDNGVDNCGSSGCGTVFNLKPSPIAPTSIFAPWWDTTLYEFTGGSDAANPYGDLVFDPAGNLYGTTARGGAYDLGAVYKLVPSNGSWTESVLYSFSGGSDGSSPSAVVMDQAGNLYGTTEDGGPNGNGTAFQLSPSGSGWTKTIIHSFKCGMQEDDGCLPVSTVGLTIDGSGNLYGATSSGSWNSGWVVFKLTPSNGDWAYTVLYSSGSNYNGPIDRLALDAAGNLYGGTQTGCASSDHYGQAPGSCDLPLLSTQGRVFKLSSGTWEYTQLHNFCDADRSGPINLMPDSQGNVFGTANGGNIGKCEGKLWHGCGVIWEITP